MTDPRRLAVLKSRGNNHTIRRHYFIAVTHLKGNTFERTLHPPCLHCDKVMAGGWSLPPSVPKTKNVRSK